MKRIVFLLSLFFIMSNCEVLADKDSTTAWNRSIDFNLAVTQNAYSDSWAGGEAGNASWATNLNSLFEGPLGARLFSKSTARLSFGQTHIQNQETKKWARPVKSTDKIDLESIASYQSKWYVDPFFGLRFESQFLDASVDSIKRYINPITLTESAGLTRRLYKKEKDFIDSRLGLALREFFDRKIIDTLSEKTETETTTDGGLESVTDLSLHLHKNIHLTSRLKLYKALTVSDENTDNWSTLDVDCENILAASVTKYVTVNLYLQWLYDKQIDRRGRFKETLALGLTFKMM
jgi:hypothetical protein